MNFTIMPSPGSRKRDLLPVRLRHEVKDAFFSSGQTVVIQVNERLIQLDLNGTLVSQDAEEVRQVTDKCKSIIY